MGPPCNLPTWSQGKTLHTHMHTQEHELLDMINFGMDVHEFMFPTNKDAHTHAKGIKRHVSYNLFTQKDLMLKTEPEEMVHHEWNAFTAKNHKQQQ